MSWRSTGQTALEVSFLGCFGEKFMQNITGIRLEDMILGETGCQINIWASLCENGTYHIGEQRRFGLLLARAFVVCSQTTGH